MKSIDGEIKASFIDRLKRYSLLYFLISPALIIFIFVALYTKIGNFIFAFSKDNFINSYGTKNEWFNEFFNLIFDENFVKLYSNTFIINIISTILLIILSIILAFYLTDIRNRFISNLFSIVMLIPFFIPTVVISNTIKIILSENNISYNFILIYIVTNLIKFLGVNISIIKIFILKDENFNNKFRSILKAVVFIVLIKLTVLYFIDYDFFYLGEIENTLLKYTYKDLFVLNLKHDKFNALWIYNFIFQSLILSIFIFYSYKIKINKYFSYIDYKNNKKIGFLGKVILFLVFSLMLLFIYIVFIKPFRGIIDAKLLFGNIVILGLVKHLFYTLLISFVSVIYSVIIAYPLIFKELPFKKIYIMILFVILPLSTSGLISYEIYIYFSYNILSKSYLMMLLLNVVNIIDIFIIKFSFEKEIIISKKSEIFSIFFREYLKKIFKIALSILIIQYSIIYGKAFYTMFFVEGNSIYKTYFSFIFNTNADSLIQMQLGALISIPPVVLFLVLVHLFRIDVMLGKLRI
jgi:ABC-type sugar transport system permease subunit